MDFGIIDLFAGAGGWDQGLSILGRRDVVGVEWDGPACETGRAAGYARVQADVTRLDPARFAARYRWSGEGFVGSPPCQSFSTAGKGHGRADANLLLAGIRQVAAGRHPRGVTARLRHRCSDPRTALVMEPLRWVLELRPGWVALEQVPPVLPLWQAYAEVLRGVGYSVAAGLVHAEALGVPQTRKRAILVASLDGDVSMPVATHSRYHSHDPQRMDLGMQPWVSMAEAFGQAGLPLPGDMMRSNYGTGGDAANRGERTIDQPAPTITSKIDRNKWLRPLASGVGVSVAEAAVLQSFPADYPWRGTRGQQYQQVGDAVPPLLAAHVLGVPLAVARSGASSPRHDAESALV